MLNIVVIGSSGHARVVIDAARLRGFEVVGILDDGRPPGDVVAGVPVLGPVGDAARLAADAHAAGCVVAIGDNGVRGRLLERVAAAAPALAWPAVIHPSAVVAADATIGDGSFIAAGVVIGSQASVGRGCLINTLACVEHDAVIGDGASLAPRATAGGASRVGAYAAVELGAALNRGASIGDDTVVTPGSVVIGSLPGCLVASGVPAVQVAVRSRGDRYL